MATADNLLNMTQNYLTPDILQKFSGALGQPVEKIQSGLKSVLPTFLMGLVSKGKTTEGAQALVNLAERDGQDAQAVNVNDASYLQKGTDAVNGIFGGQLNTVTSSLSTTTGMNSSAVTKMLSLIAPMVMGAIGSKVKRENLSASGLSGFLNQQKSSLSSFLPAGMAGLFGGGATAFKGALGQEDGLPHYAARRRPWGTLALMAALLIGFLWWMSSSRNATRYAPPAPATIQSSDTTLRESVSQPAAPAEGFVAAAPAISDLGTFLSAGDEAGLPKRFAFQNLVFETGTSALGTGAQSEIDQIAQVLKDYPAATARIEGFTDNTGSMTGNIALSAERAQAVKEQLVSRGVEDNRIEAVGRGSEEPIADNANEAGRSQNRRIEFILTNIK